MKLGIVGHEAKKFTPEAQELARQVIRRWIGTGEFDTVISGHSPLGGIDWWAVEEAEKLGLEVVEYAPTVNRWYGLDGQIGFRERNLQIAENSDVVICIVVRKLPPTYSGRVFPRGCYHCHTPLDHHVKSGGCWTMKEAERLGKRTALEVIY